MPKDRYFTELKLQKPKIINISGNEASHIKSVMRKKINDKIEIINGKGYLAKAKIINISPKEVKVHLQKVVFEKENNQKSILIQAYIKPNKMDLVLEKATELGIDEFWFFKAKNSENSKITKNRESRMQNILISAIKQSSRLYLPKIKLFNSLNTVKISDGIIYFGDIRKKTKKLFAIFKKTKKNIYFVIGPEKGLVDDEIEYLEKNLKAIGTKLNNNILRSETAAITASSLTSHLLQSCKPNP